MANHQGPLSRSSSTNKADMAGLSDGTHSNGNAVGGKGDKVELSKLDPEKPQLPVEEDVMQLARLGEIGAIQKLFDSGTYDISYKDEEGITPLHWAAINNQYALCKYLIDAGADVNAKGGQSVATPAMWAAQRCHTYVVDLLFQRGADPLVADLQGYNVLHLATFDGNVLLLALLLHQNIPVDAPDPHGHTCLMWAAYKGFPACVDLFLRWGADIHATDESGFSALHWSLVKGSQGCIQKLIEYGSDRHLKTATGKSPATVAEEMKSLRIWHRALEECGYDEDGNPIPTSLPLISFMKGKKREMSQFFFFWPFLIIFSIITILSNMVIFAALPIALAVGYSLNWVAKQALQWAPSNMKNMHRTPFLAGIFAGTCFWVGARWFTKILPYSYSSSPFLNLIFATFYGLCSYFYICCLLFDPGYVPRLAGLSQQKAVIDELISEWNYDEQHFCVQCMIRMPLRSKHCKRCARCVAKHDHHCPWIHNCVGVNNHRHFFFYILTMAFGITSFIFLVLSYLKQLPPPQSSKCNIVSEELCSVLLKDPFTIILTAWAGLQLTWVTMLLIVQLVQIARGQTTYENMQRHKHPGAAGEMVGSAVTAGSTTFEGAQLTGQNRGPDPVLDSHGHGHGHGGSGGFFATWKRLLGLDTFVATARGGLNGTSSRKRQNRNPFSRGYVTNCKDFLCDPAPVFGERNSGAAMLGGEVINYNRMYETPEVRMSTRRGDSAGQYESVSMSDNV